MEVNLKDLMEKSDITEEDLEYIVYRLWKGGCRCGDLTEVFIKAHYKARCKFDEEKHEKHYYKNINEVAHHISKWVLSRINNYEDDSYP